MLCEIVWQLKMDGQTRFMHARKTRRTGGWTRIRDGIRRRKKHSCQVEGNVFFGGKGELAGQIDAVFFSTMLVTI